MLHTLATLLLTVPGSASADLEARFFAAERAPDAIPALLVDGSAAVARSDRDQAARLADRLEPYARRLFFGPERVAGMDRLGLVIHTVSSGENPTRIARRYRIPPELIERLNERYEPRKLRVGQELKVLDLRDAELRVVVDTTGFRVTAWRDLAQGAGAVIVMHVPVGLGAIETNTPTGTTHVVQRVRDPEWRHPVTREVFPPGHPENVLGGYWIELAPEGIGKDGIGFHGYTGEAPERWIERRASNGCVRMRQPDIDCLYRLVLDGTTVVLAP